MLMSLYAKFELMHMKMRERFAFFFMRMDILYAYHFSGWPETIYGGGGRYLHVSYANVMVLNYPQDACGWFWVKTFA